MLSISVRINRSLVAQVVVLFLMMIPIFYDYYVTVPHIRQLKGNDIYYIWNDGEDMSKAINPYSRIHGSDMRQNQKYTTYLPGFFILEILAIEMGVLSFDQFFPIWRILITLIYCLIAIQIYLMVKKRSANVALALFSAYFWIFGRWSLSTLRSWQIDFVAIALLLLALSLLDSRKHLAYFLLGCSLSIKQIAVFALPLFVILEMRDRSLIWADLKNTFVSFMWIFAVPILSSLPFIYLDSSGFFLSIIFSLTRSPGGLKLEGIDRVLGLIGTPAKIPLLISLSFVYWLYWKRSISLAQGILLSFVSFVSFNSVVFKQYLPWSSAFLGLALADYVETIRKKLNYIKTTD